MFTIKGGLAEQLGFPPFSINLDTVTLKDGQWKSYSPIKYR